MEEEIKSKVEQIKVISEEIESAASENSAAGKSESPKEKKPFAQWPVFGWFLNSKSAAALAGKCALLLVIPYVYLFILCAIFDSLKAYGAAGFILYSSAVFLAANIALIVWAIVRFRKKKG